LRKHAARERQRCAACALRWKLSETAAAYHAEGFVTAALAIVPHATAAASTPRLAECVGDVQATAHSTQHTSSVNTLYELSIYDSGCFTVSRSRMTWVFPPSNNSLGKNKNFTSKPVTACHTCKCFSPPTVSRTLQLPLFYTWHVRHPLTAQHGWSCVHRRTHACSPATARVHCNTRPGAPSHTRCVHCNTRPCALQHSPVCTATLARVHCNTRPCAASCSGVDCVHRHIPAFTLCWRARW